MIFYRNEGKDKMKKFYTKIIQTIKYFLNPEYASYMALLKKIDTKPSFLTSKQILQEVLYANYLHDSIKESCWLKKQVFTATKGAANYSMLFTLFSILENTNVINILEMGLGQSSKITSQYVNNKNQSAQLTIVEHNKEWIDAFKKNLDITKNIKIINPEIESVDIKNSTNIKYRSFTDNNNPPKYDFIIVDGPMGYNQKFPRSNILDLIPQNLAKNFIIVLDDYERKGEQNTAKLIFKKLKKNNIKYKTSLQIGCKAQLIITSPDYEFLHWI